jgi:hypothetical protein
VGCCPERASEAAEFLKKLALHILTTENYRRAIRTHWHVLKRLNLLDMEDVVSLRVEFFANDTAHPRGRMPNR